MYSSTCNQQKKGRLDNNNVCKECRTPPNGTAAAAAAAEALDEGEEVMPALPADWMTTPMSTLLGGHLLQLITQKTKPIPDALDKQVKQMNELKESNKKLKTDNKDRKQRFKMSRCKECSSWWFVRESNDLLHDGQTANTDNERRLK